MRTHMQSPVNMKATLASVLALGVMSLVVVSVAGDGAPAAASTDNGLECPAQVMTIDRSAATPMFLGNIGIDVNGSGDIFVSDDESDRVYRFDADGNQELAIGGFSSMLALVAADDDGNVYVADRSAKSVFRHDVNGVQTLTIPGFVWPVGVAVDNSGDIYVSDRKSAQAVYRFDADGDQELAITTATPPFGNPAGVAVDDDGNIYVAAQEGVGSPGGGVYRFNAAGAQTLYIPQTDADPEFFDPTGIAVDTAGDCPAFCVRGD